MPWSTIKDSMTSASENDDDGDDRLDAMLREADLLASQMRRMNGEGLDDDDSPTAEETDRTVEEMLRGAEFLISQMDPGSGGSSLSASQNPSRHSVTDVDLDEMLKKAEHLATKMTTKASESEIRDHAAVRKVDPPNAQEHDDVPGQAQLLASKMRNFQNSLVQGGDEDDEEFVVDEMLVRAGILAQSMQCTSIADEKYDAPDTHSLIGRSEALLERVNWRDKSPNHLDDTPELIRQTDLLLSQMSHHIRDDCSIKSTDSPVDDMIRQTQVLLDQFHDAASPMPLPEKNGDDILAGDAIETSRQGFSRPPRAPRPPGTPSMLNRPSPVTPSPRTKDAQESNDRAAQEQQMTQLIQDTLTALATVNGQSDLATVLRGNAALMEQAMASLQNAKKNATKPDPPERLTPTLVSIRPYGEDSEVSSVGSGSARSLPLLGRATSFDLTSPPICKGAKRVLIGNPDSVDAAVELSKQMAAALEETFSQSSDLAENREEPPTIPELDHGLDEASLRKLEEQRKWEQTLQDEEVAVIADFSKQREGHTKSIRFEKVVNAADGDDDYVPLVDYTKLGRGTPLQPSVKSNRRSPASKGIRRRKEIIRIVASSLGLILVRFTWLWLQRQMGEGVGEQGLSLLAENAIGPLHDVAPSTNGMEGRIADDLSESISDVPVIADVNTDNDDVNSDNEDVSVYTDEDRWDEDEDDIDNELEAFGADETEFDESESESVYGEEFKSRVDISIVADQDAVEIDAIGDYLDDDDEFEENEESYVDYGEEEYYDELFNEETERIEVNNDQEVYSAALAESMSDAPVISNVATPVDSMTSNDQFKYAEGMIVSYTSDAVETTLYDDPIPKGCLVPFSYLVSKDCRTIANHRPLVDVHGIVDTMLQ